MLSFKNFILESTESKMKTIKELEKELLNVENEDEIRKIQSKIEFLKDELSKNKQEKNDEDI